MVAACTPTSEDQLLADFYAQPGVFTTLDGAAAALADAAPDDVAAIVRLVQGLLIHEGLTGLYGASPPPERAAEKQLQAPCVFLRQATRSARAACRAARPGAPGHRRLPPLRDAVRGDHAGQGRAGAGSLRLCDLLRAGQAGGPLGRRVLDAAAHCWVLGRAVDDRNGATSSLGSTRWTAPARRSSWSAAMPGAPAAPAPPDELRRRRHADAGPRRGLRRSLPGRSWRRCRRSSCCRGAGTGSRRTSGGCRKRR